MAATPLAVVAGETVPQPGEQGVEFWVNVQFTPAAPGSFATVAVNFRDTLMGISALYVESDNVIAGTVIMAVLVTAVLKTDVAVRLTGRSLSGAVGGAVYVVGVPLAVVVGDAVPQGAGEHDTVQLTP